MLAVSIDGQKVIATFLGNEINCSTFFTVSLFSGVGVRDYIDCEEYVVLQRFYERKRSLLTQFNVSSALLDEWNREAVAFKLYLYVRSGVLVGGRIVKHIRANGTQQARFLAPTREELGVVERILDYIIQRR